MKWIVQKLSQLSVWGILFFALLLRLPLLNGSFWLDEAAQALESIRPLYLQLEIAEDFQPPLLHLLVHVAAYFSHAEWWLRVWGALVPGLVTIYCTYKIAEVLFSKKVAQVSTILLTLSSFHIFYSQELRPYSLSAAVAAVSWWLLVQAFFGLQGSTKKLSFKLAFAYAITTALGLYSTYLYPFVVLSQISYVIWKEKAVLKQYFASLLVSGLLFLPWLPFLYEQLQVGQSLRKSLPGWEAVVSIPQLKSLPLILGKFMFGVLNIEPTPLFLISSVIFLAGIGWTAFLLWQQHRKFLLSRPIILLLCWLIIPIITAWLASFAIPIVQPKRVLYLLPVFYILTTGAVLELQQKHQNFWQMLVAKVSRFFGQDSSEAKIETVRNVWLPVAATVGILLFLNIYSTIEYYLNPLYQREDWRAAQQKITSEYATDGAVIFAFNTAFASWEWYDEKSYPVFAVGNLTQAEVGQVEAKLKKASEYPYLLVFDYLRDLSDPDRKVEAALHNLGYKEVDTFAYPGIGFVRVFARQEDVLSYQL